MSDTQPIEGQEQPTAEAERDALLSRVRELAVLVRSSDISKSQLLSDYSAGEADGLGLALLVMCGGEGVKEEYARASRKLRKLLGWRPMNELPPGDGEYPIMNEQELREIPVASIDRDPGQPRTHFDEGALHELAESIKKHGVIQPIEVEETPDGRYVIHHGERRWRAAALAGRETIPAVVAPPRAADEALVRGLIENLHREDLNPIEEARVFQRLIGMGWPRMRISRETGRAHGTINARLVWLRLEEEIQQLVALGHLTADRELADALYVLPERVRVPLAQKIAAKHLGAKGAIRAAQALAEKLAQREAAETEGASRRPTITVASRPLHPTPMVRTAVPYANGSGPAPVATLAQASEAMCRSCVFMPKGNVIPSWELLAQVAAETCDECQRRSGPAVPRVCAQCPGVVLLRRFVNAPHPEPERDEE